MQSILCSYIKQTVLYIIHCLLYITCIVEISASENAGPAGTADGGGGEGIGELRPTLCNQLPGRLQGCGAPHGDILVISQDHHDVGSLLAPCHADAEDEVECDVA